MITYYILFFLAWAFDGLITLLPSATTLPAGIDSAVSYFLPIWAQFNYIFPVSTFFSILSFVLVVEGSIFLFGLINFVYNKIRGSGG